MTADLAQTYAEYMLRVAAWEVQIARATCMDTLARYFPSLKAKVTDKEKVKFSVPSVYIGTGEDLNLCFWVRLCPSVESTSDDIGELREKDKLFEKHTSFCYYRRHPLSAEVCEELDLAGFADSSSGEDKGSGEESVSSAEKEGGGSRGAVLPPPKRPKKNEIFVSMLVRNTSDLDLDRGGLAELDDVAFSVENEFEDGVSNNIMYETEPMSGVDSPRKSKSSRAELVRGSRGEGVGEVWSSKSSPFAEVFGWGRNTAFLFDKTKERVADRSASMLTPDANKKMADHDSNYVCFDPTAISIPPSIHLERVRMIACSPNHMMLLTYNGSVYSCGDNTEGALGLGDTKNRQSLDLVLWPADMEEKPRHVVSISAGAAAIGAHSMAITESGELYGWGVAYAAGHGTAKKSVTVPQKIFMPQPREVLLAAREEAKKRRVAGEDAEQEEAMTAAELQLRDELEEEAAGSAAVKHVACGGGFTVAVLASGHVATWGMWSHGRLGLGPPPRIEGETKKARGRNKRKVVRYQLRPRLLPALRRVEKVRAEWIVFLRFDHAPCLRFRCLAARLTHCV